MTRIAVAQYQIEKLSRWQAYEDKMVRMVEQAKENDADLLVMSEYAGLELASWTENILAKQFEYIQSVLDQYHQLFLSLAHEYQLYIQPGTLPVKESDGYYRNRGFLFAPDGNIAHQDKIYLTQFELQTKCIRPGTELHAFDTSFGKIGLSICYDCEFPQLVKRLTEADVKLILVPSCTEKMSGLTRVSICSQARAIENQCYVAQSSLIGNTTWNDFIDINAGQSGIYCPADIGFPEDGILAQAQLNTPMLIYADLSWDKLEHVRQQGEMRNFQDSKKDIDSLITNTEK